MTSWPNRTKITSTAQKQTALRIFCYFHEWRQKNQQTKIICEWNSYNINGSNFRCMHLLYFFPLLFILFFPILLVFQDSFHSFIKTAVFISFIKTIKIFFFSLPLLFSLFYTYIFFCECSSTRQSSICLLLFFFYIYIFIFRCLFLTPLLYFLFLFFSCVIWHLFVVRIYIC